MFGSAPASTYVITVPKRYGQTTYCGITALCVASRGKNYYVQSYAVIHMDGELRFCYH